MTILGDLRDLYNNTTKRLPQLEIMAHLLLTFLLSSPLLHIKARLSANLSTVSLSGDLLRTLSGIMKQKGLM